MADIKWSAFSSVGAVLTTDALVGLRSGTNVRFVIPQNLRTTDSPTFNNVTVTTLNTLTAGFGPGGINSNTAFGVQALNVNTGGRNTVAGFNAMLSSTADIENTAFGWNSMAALNGGNGNVAVGYGSCAVMTTGDGNVCVGAATGTVLTSGQGNTFIGGGSGEDVTSGSNNTFLGEDTGVDSLTASGCLALGCQAIANISTGVTSGTAGPGIAIGSSLFPIGFRGDGSIYSGGTGRGYWRPNINSTHYLMPMFIDGTLTTSASMVTDANGSPILSSAMTNGQVIVGSTSATPVAATLTAGTGIAITNGAGSITISTSGDAGWVNQNTSSVVMAINTGYTINNGASLVTLTLPAAAAIGDMVEINGQSSGGWTIAQASGQLIHIGSATTTTGATGTLSSTNQYDCVKLRCLVANTTWTVVSQQSGGLTVV